MLVTDGHSSHLSWQFISFAAEHDILLVCLPPHTSHLLQPLDVGLFGPEGHYLSKELFHPALASANAPTDREMLECIIRARFPAFTERSVRSAWKMTGIWPPFKEHVLDEVINLRPLTPPHDEAAGESDFLRTPARAREVDLLMGGLINKLELTPQSLQRVNKVAKQPSRVKRTEL